MDQERIYILLSRKFSGEATETELREIEQLLVQHPELETIIQQLSGLWHQQPVRDTEFLEATYFLHQERMKEKGYEFHSPEISDISFPGNAQLNKGKKLLRKPAFVALFSLLITAAGLWFFLKQTGKAAPLAESGNNEISTRNGSRTRIQLPDGSTVWLNAGSKLEYDKSFGNNIREVHLNGEAFFDVVKNPEKPFIVKTSAANIKVLGTSFNVRSYPEDNKIEASLIRGSVEVTLNKRPNEKWVLKPNEKLVLLNEYITTPQAKTNVYQKQTEKEPVIAIKRLTYQPGETIAVEAAWTNNKLSFEDESFIEVAQKMARWYDVKFLFKNKQYEELMLHGSFTTETINQAMEALQYSFKFKYEIKDKEVTIF